MKYLSDRDERKTWVVLTAIWASGGMLAWFSCLVTAPLPLASSTVTMLAVVVATMGVVFRLPILVTQPKTDELADHIVLLLGYAATINWLGFLVLRCSSLIDAIPALLIVTFAEVWVHRRFMSADCLAWIRPAASQFIPVLGGSQSVANNGLGVGSDQGLAEVSINATAVLDDEFESVALQSVCSVCSKELSEEFSRRSHEGLDENGHRFASGAVHVEMHAGQKTEQVVVGFCPAFEGNPEIDFEVDHENVTVRMLNCTPAGVRFELHRRDTADSVTLVLEWYARQTSPTETKRTDERRILP